MSTRGPSVGGPPCPGPAVATAARLLIGIHVEAQALNLAATVHALHRQTAQVFDLVLLVEGGDEALRQALCAVASVHQLALPEGVGAAGAFNRLIAEPADVYVLLENGVQPGPGWLDHVLAALQADKANGLAGPSTNRCWNEQGAVAAPSDHPDDVARQARALTDQHHGNWQSLAPRHSLSDFCLAVRREVVAAVGAADAVYADGPCWEMDYNLRAARAGYRGVWAKAAYVHRAPLTRRREVREARLLGPNRSIYRERYCTLQHAGGQGPHCEASCHGDGCAHFAPAERMHIYLPVTTAPPRPQEEFPLVSCIMPTRGRPAFVAQAIAYFRRQDYPCRELIIVHEESSDLPPGMKEEAAIRIVQAPPRSSIGSKRSLGTAAAAGELIAHWDDDDWYAPQRLSRQALPLRQGVADISGLADILFMVRPNRQFWAVTPALFARLFLEGVSGGTLMFRRSVWQRSGPYPETSLREDADFMAKAMREGARLSRVPGRELCIYVRHDGNTWKFKEGSYLQESGWMPQAEPAFLAEDRAFYFPTGVEPLRSVPSRAPRLPLVSCIMPTANRRQFVPHAIRYFLAQDYPNRELIIVDDGSDSVADLVPQVDNIRYLRLERRATVGAKRNLACEMARGELVAHWDDDDWMAPGWLRSQVRTLQEQDAELCGLDRVYFYAPETRTAWRYIYDGVPPWAAGGTLCYTRELWQRSPFADLNIGEDNVFVWSAQRKRLAINPAGELYVATVHRHNTSPKGTANRRWHSVPATQVERLMVPAVRWFSTA